MPVLFLQRVELETPQARRVVIESPGLYPLTPGQFMGSRETHWPRGVWLALLVCHLGDFVTRRASGSETQSRYVVRLSGRPLLGDLERLSGEVQVDLSGVDSAAEARVREASAGVYRSTMPRAIERPRPAPRRSFSRPCQNRSNTCVS